VSSKINFNELEVQNIVFDGIDIDTITFDENIVWERVVTDLTNIELWEGILDIIQDNSGIDITPTLSTFGSLTGTSKWNGGVIAKNGKIYAAPNNSPSILEIDTETNTTFTFGNFPVTGEAWPTCVLANNGLVYGIPGGGTDSILEIDIENRIAEKFGAAGFNVNTAGFIGGALSQNGNMYCSPARAEFILIIDPQTKTVSTLGSFGTNVAKWYGECVSPINKMIYSVPSNGSGILKIDTLTDEYSTFGTIGGSLAWAGFVLGTNNKMYGIPRNNNNVVEVDTELETTSTFASGATGTAKWAGGFLAPNGIIYSIPFTSSRIARISTNPRSSSVFGDVGTDESKWSGAIMAPNNKAYCIPSNATEVLVIDFGSDLKNIPLELLVSAYVNKF